MIMLICRWMCPESLHVYRRMGTREHERLINEASSMNVDAIQSANVVRVVGDQGYAALFADLQLNQSAHSRDFNRTSNTAQDTRTRQLTPAEPTTPTAAASAAATRAASATNIRRPTSAPAIAARHHAARRLRGRPS